MLSVPSSSGVRFGPSKSFQANNARLATPRRALGDLGNLHFESKSNGIGKPFGNTPRLQQLHGSASSRNSHKKRNALKAIPREEKVEPQFPDKENMFPFIEKGTVFAKFNLNPKLPFIHSFNQPFKKKLYGQSSENRQFNLSKLSNAKFSTFYYISLNNILFQVGGGQ